MSSQIRLSHSAKIAKTQKAKSKFHRHIKQQRAIFPNLQLLYKEVYNR